MKRNRRGKERRQEEKDEWRERETDKLRDREEARNGETDTKQTDIMSTTPNSQTDRQRERQIYRESKQVTEM